MNTRRLNLHAPRDTRGFTLLELLVVVSILVMIFGVAIASFNSFNRRSRLQQAALNFKSALRFAQTRAISAEKPSGGCTTFVGMRVAFPGAGSYTIDHECTEGTVGTVETTTLPSGITFVSIPTAFTFQTLPRLTTLVSDQTIRMTNTVETYAIRIATNGDITDMGFQ